MNRIQILVLATVIALGVGSYFYLNRPQPIVRQGLPLANVTMPQLSAAEKAGEAAYNKYCVACHGANAAGQDGVAPPFVHRIYEPNHHGDIAFQMAAKSGVRAHHWPFGDMPPVDGVTQDEVNKIITYVRALQRANGIN